MTERLEQILDYYREKSDKIENERTEWMQQLHYIQQSVQNVHLKEREVLQKKIAIAEQQRALSESHILTIEEKLQELMIIKDNEELQRTREKDLIKIRELMSLAEDFKKDYKPRDVKVIDSRPKDTPKESLALQKTSKSRKNTSQTYVSKYKQSTKILKSNKSGKIKTIFLPHEDVNKLRGQIERLKQYKQDQRDMYTQCLNAYEKDKAIK